MARRHVYSKRAADTKRMNDLHAVAKAFDGFLPASEVFTRVLAVPTIFNQFDHGVRVGGLPTQRIALVHGPSGEGKTYFTLGLARSFLRVENPVFFVDAERTLEQGFIDLAIGDYAKSRLFMGTKPDTYEATRTAVRKWCNTVAALRKAGTIAPDACGLVIVDSIRKLVPAEQWKMMLELIKNAGKDEKALTRINQQKAAMNATWCDELIPLLEQTNCTMVIIARETDDPDAPPPRAMPGRPPPPRKKKVGGGQALYYDASLDIEVTRQRFVTKKGAEGERPTVYGERHRITIKKSKVSGKEDKTIVCYFHTSNGKLIPEGFDRARDLVELGMREGVIKGGKKPQSGEAATGWMQWKGQKWQGEHAAVKKLYERPELLAELERAVRAKFRNAKPIEVTADGEVIES